jgi:hypothetical protein
MKRKIRRKRRNKMEIVNFRGSRTPLIGMRAYRVHREYIKYTIHLICHRRMSNICPIGSIIGWEIG